MCVYICYWYVCVDVCASHSGPTDRCVCLCACMCICVYVYIIQCMCVHVCVCMSLNIAWNAMETHQSMNNCDSNTRALRAHDIIQ